MEETDNQTENTSKPWLWKKGQSGNLAGRPKGKTMKEFAKEYLSLLNDEERDSWLEGLSKEIVWKMAEGNPSNDSKVDVTTKGEKISTLPPEAIAIIEEDLKKKKLDEKP